jgi:indole-3-glycerol phosphate synthase
MGTILDQIVASKRREIEQSQKQVPPRELLARLEDVPSPLDFRARLQAVPGMAVIAEVKKASPSAGVLRSDFEPAEIAALYERHGAACISVLTDSPYFQGHLLHLSAVRQAVACPILRKDFILDEYQVLEARVAGADAVLLIAEVLDQARLIALLKAAESYGMEALVELYDADNLARVLDAGAAVIGINNRDLRSFATRLEHTLELAPRVPADRCLVSESGIRSRQDVRNLRAAGVRAVLVGETLLRAADIGAKLEELRGVGDGEVT